MAWHEFERTRLARALATAGPDAPTLCSGWRTRHLVAHLVLREHAPLVAAGLAFPPLAARTAAATEELAETARDVAGYAALLARLDTLPPAWHPAQWAGDAMNLLEYVVHAEDVLRATGTAPPVTARLPEPAGRDAAVWRLLAGRARMLYRSAPCGVVLVVPGGPRVVARHARRGGEHAGQVVVLRGAVTELVMHAHGRGDHAEVRLGGQPSAVTAMAAWRTTV